MVRGSRLHRLEWRVGSCWTVTTGMDFPRDYSNIPDISSYPLNLPRHSLSTPRHPLMVTPECTDYSLTSPEVYPVYPDYPLRCPEKPMSALRTPWHPLMVIPDGPNYPLSFPEGHLKSLKTPWHPLRCEDAFLGTKIFVLSLRKRENVVRNVT